MIDAGRVTVDGAPALKAARQVAPHEAVVVHGEGPRYVGRGGDKLAAALDRFAVPVEGARALDAGASTGGFTDCLLQRGAAHVVAVDVGYGQLDWRLRQDPRVTVMERTNVRDLRLGDLPYEPAVLTADLSFISLRLALPAMVAVAAEDADFVLLVKPQFEAGREDVGTNGVVADPAVWARVLRETVGRADHEGVRPRALMASPLVGPAGNVEFLLHAVRSTTAEPRDLERAIADAVEEGRRIRSGG